MNHVDVNMFGSLPLELYLLTKDKKYWYLGLPYADSQWELPRKANQGERNGLKKDIPGKHVCGLMICI